ncbi:universal stress protein [Lysobacter auxotrophicus]|uniref:Universal stress protein n=1 Tax=Lysobacter auxotrophicus TaxID=2992573 RepID=A0ABM8DD24_9GAMM|nr:universal stress protein [Lysobacter auxotrophicus]BDU16492.1 universal stress protein [Lysobacter auxotrophicus]
MNQPFPPATPPRRILLATDLSSRADRAFDRAVQLCNQWGAELHVLHAVEAMRPAIPFGVDAHAYIRGRRDPCADAERLLRRTLTLEQVRANVHVEEGSASHAILAVAQREDCDLVILGENRDRLVGPFEGTLDHVVRASPASVLAVRSRPYAPYRNLMVGTDFTDESQQALATSACWFPGADIAFVHAYSMPYSGLLPRESQEWADGQLAHLRRHLHETGLPDGARASVRLLVDAGPPAIVLPRHAQELEADLTVIGAHPRGMLFDAVVGSSRLIIDAIPGDVLVVRAVRGDRA